VRDVDWSFKYPTETKFVWWGVSSCTLSLDILQSDAFLGTQGIRTLFSIECKSGKPIGSHSYFKNSEQEVIIMPGSYFEVMGQLNPAAGLLIIQLKQIDPPIVFVKPPFTINQQHFSVPNVDTKVQIQTEHKSVKHKSVKHKSVKHKSSIQTDGASKLINSMPSGHTTHSSIYQSGNVLSKQMKPPAGK
jgi:hypothetical protein